MFHYKETIKTLCNNNFFNLWGWHIHCNTIRTTLHVYIYLNNFSRSRAIFIVTMPKDYVYHKNQSESLYLILSSIFRRKKLNEAICVINNQPQYTSWVICITIYKNREVVFTVVGSTQTWIAWSFWFLLCMVSVVAGCRVLSLTRLCTFFTLDEICCL